MNEQILIQAKPKYKMRTLAVIMFFSFFALDLIILLIHSLINYGSGPYSYYLPYVGRVEGYHVWSPINMIDSLEDLFPLAIILFIIGLVLAILLYLSKNELTVTDKRIYGQGFLGKRVDLPLDSVSAIATTILFLKGVTISTSSGKISFFFIANREEMYQSISQLLVGRQYNHSNPNTSTNTSTPPPTSTTDELKKYKELLDEGIITQEEFDAKKKQLLDL